MNRMEFMQALERALNDISSEEREAALQYYCDYLDDAGPENEQAILREWGSPEKLAEAIRGGMDGKLENGEFTERGFSSGEEKECPAERGGERRREREEREKPAERERGRINAWKWLAIALLCIILAPICIPVVIALLAVVFSILIAVVIVIAALAVAGIALFAAGTVIALKGAATVFAAPAGAAVLFGAGLVLAAVGALMTLLFGWAAVKCGVVCFRGLVELCRKPFHRKRREGTPG